MATIPETFPRSDALPEMDPLNLRRARYMEGRCWLLAVELADQTGLELAILWDYAGYEDGEPVPLHVFCREEKWGRAVDAYGVVDDEDEMLVGFDQEWNLARPEDPGIDGATRQQVLDLFNGGEEPDPADLEQVRADLIAFGLSRRPALSDISASATSHVDERAPAPPSL